MDYFNPRFNLWFGVIIFHLNPSVMHVCQGFAFFRNTVKFIISYAANLNESFAKEANSFALITWFVAMTLCAMSRNYEINSILSRRYDNTVGQKFYESPMV